MNAHSSFIAQSFKASFAAEDSSLLMPSNKTNDVTKDLLAPSDSWLKSVDKSELQVSVQTNVVCLLDAYVFVFAEACVDRFETN